MFFPQDQTHYNAQFFTWIIFYQTDSNQEFKNLLKPPYNSEVIVIKSRSPEIYELIEVYGIIKQLFSISYGKWINSVGLTTMNESFYERRKNTNKSLIAFEVRKI